MRSNCPGICGDPLGQICKLEPLENRWPAKGKRIFEWGYILNTPSVKSYESTRAIYKYNSGPTKDPPPPPISSSHFGQLEICTAAVIL